jgi:hypothetical protein
MKSCTLHIALLLFLLGLGSCLNTALGQQLSPSQYNYPNNHLPWYTIESEHFNIHFQEGNNGSAQATARIAETIYPKVTNLYNLEPDTKTNIVLRDRRDYSNGAAYFFDNQIDIWVSSLNTPLRGTHDWLWDVITHEFIHIVQLQAAMKKDRRIPAIYFQWLSYSDVRRPDVLYGYPKGILTYPFASINVPAWLAEGVAQYQRQNLFFDYWDAHRDMLFRTAVLSGDPISFVDMGIFGSKNVLQRERIYNQGFAFTSYLADRFGEQILPALSEQLGKPGVFTVDKALKQATGISATDLFNDFIIVSEKHYRKATESLQPIETKSVQPRGFFNFYPTVTPSGDQIAYLSNKNSRSPAVQLFVENRDGTEASSHAIDIGPLQSSDQRYGIYKSQEPTIKHLQSSFSFSPDGSQIAFSRQKLNNYGERYNDLFIYDRKTKTIERLTHSKRLSSPGWHPTKNALVAIQQSNGSTNLVEIDLATSSLRPFTNFNNGQQVYSPRWHINGEELYFSFSDNHSRNIYRLNTQSETVEAVLQDTLTDYRDPYIDEEGSYLYYAANPDGIFNIYRIPLNGGEPSSEPLTSVIGGAFMPHVNNETLYFSEFKTDGYIIASIDLTTAAPSPAAKYKRDSLSYLKLPEESDLNYPPSTENINSIKISKLQQLNHSDSLMIPAENNNQQQFKLMPYENNYTGFSFYPVIRFDNYSKKNGSNGRLLTAGQFGDLGRNLLRDMKLGTYFSSREVTGQINFFGSALFGFASEPGSGIGDFLSPSRLTDLDRDLYLSVEHAGLPFIKKRWSPTVTLGFYNLRRNVADGISVEEFPCTSCLPDTTNVDIAYNIWEADIFLRSKINQHNLVELGAGYSPYRVQTDGFYSQELESFIPSSSSEYFKGTTFTAAYIYENRVPYPNNDVAPIGFRGALQYTYEPNKLLDDYEVEDGTLNPIYQEVKNHSLEANLRLGYPIGHHSALNFYGRGFSYLNNPDDFFYLDYIGGFTGMRSYPYFALGGNTTALAKLSYTFPIANKLNTQVGRHTFDKLYLRLFAEGGNGWNGPLEIGDNLKAGVGGELRFAFNSYYLFPLKLFISGAYGFNKFDVTLPSEFITESTGSGVTYGQDFYFHFGLTFDFDVLNHD